MGNEIVNFKDKKKIRILKIILIFSTFKKKSFMFYY